MKRLLKSHNAAESGEKQLGFVSSVSEEKDTEMAKTKFLNYSFPGRGLLQQVHTSSDYETDLHSGKLDWTM